MDLSHASHQPLEPGQEISTTGEILAYAARTCADKVGLIDGDKQWTFADLDRLANQTAHGLMQANGRESGPVGILGKNSAEYAIAHFGIARTGRRSVNLPTRCTADELAFAVNLTKPVVLVVDDDSRTLAESALPRFEITPELIGGGDFWKFIETHPSTPVDHSIDPDAGGSVIFTGGTTGRPKAVLSSQRARAVSAMAAVEDFRIRRDVIAGYSVPFTHTAGLFSWFQPAVLACCTGVVIPKWDPELFMELTERYGINMTFAVPAQLATLLDHPAFDADRLRSLTTLVFGGAPLSRTLIERAEKAMPWMECGRAYGSSETGHLAAQIKSDRDAVYDGYNQPGGRLEIEIFKEPGVVAEEGEIGEVATRGAHLMTGYIENDDANTEFFKSDTTGGQWGWMGDLAVKHEAYFSLAGRSKHMILSGGLNIFPAELEEILSGHPAVSDCAVFGVDDPTWGELPCAAVVANDEDAEAEDIKIFVADQVARYKRIRRIYFVDQIPRTAAGKIRVFLVKEKCLG
jgi:fatty-acyl-CoA synthase